METLYIYIGGILNIFNNGYDSEADQQTNPSHQCGCTCPYYQHCTWLLLILILRNQQCYVFKRLSCWVEERVCKAMSHATEATSSPQILSLMLLCPVEQGLTHYSFNFVLQTSATPHTGHLSWYLSSLTNLVRELAAPIWDLPFLNPYANFLH